MSILVASGTTHVALLSVVFSLTVMLLAFLGICGKGKTKLTDQVNIRFDENAANKSSRKKGSNRRNRVPNINPQKKNDSRSKETQGISNTTMTPTYDRNPITPTFNKFRKGTGFDNEGFENDLDMAMNDLSSNKKEVDESKSLQFPRIPPPEEEEALPPPPDLTASMKRGQRLELPAALVPPPPEEVEGAPTVNDIEKALQNISNESEVDLVPLHEMEIAAEESFEKAKPRKKYISEIKDRQRSIFRPSKQYLIEEGVDPEDIRTLPRHPNVPKYGSGNASPSVSGIDAKI